MQMVLHQVIVVEQIKVVMVMYHGIGKLVAQHHQTQMEA
jgi:hypothetical protein